MVQGKDTKDATNSEPSQQTHASIYSQIDIQWLRTMNDGGSKY